MDLLRDQKFYALSGILYSVYLFLYLAIPISGISSTNNDTSLKYFLVASAECDAEKESNLKDLTTEAESHLVPEVLSFNPFFTLFSLNYKLSTPLSLPLYSLGIITPPPEA